VTIAQIWLHFAHRIGAVLVSIAVIAAAEIVLRHHRDQPKLVVPALLLLGLLATQVVLGLLTVYLRKPADIASAHVAVGALTLVTTFVTTVRAIRLYGWVRRPAAAAIEPAAAETPEAEWSVAAG